ncbi:hypothetical protein JYU04_03010, partial [Dehalococcoides mccartyi]|nr:hypothetical protein [Dehalococcoides mccartyi]
MPEWTPIKVTGVGLLLVVIVLIAQDFFPRQSTRDFTSDSVLTDSFEFSELKLAAFKGLNTAVRSNPFGWSTSSSSDRGGLITGTIRNTSAGTLFVPDEVKTSTKNLDEQSGFRPTTLLMEIKGAEFIKNWYEIPGYLIQPNESHEFRLVSAKLEIEKSDLAVITIEWKYVDVDTSQQFADNSRFTFEQVGTSIAWGETNIEWQQPFAVSHPEIVLPFRP